MFFLGLAQRSQRVDVAGRDLSERLRRIADRGKRFAEASTHLAQKIIHSGEQAFFALRVDGIAVHRRLRIRIDDLRSDAHATTDFRDGRYHERSCAFTHGYFGTYGAVDQCPGWIMLHALERSAHLQLRNDVDVARLLQTYAERALQRFVEDLLSRQVLQITDHDPVAIRECNRRRRFEQVPRRDREQQQHDERFGKDRDGASPHRHLAIRLARPGGRLQRREAFLADFEHRHEVRHALEAVASVRAPAHARECFAEFALGTVRDVVRGARHQDLARQGETHQARGDGFDEALDFGAFGATLDVIGRVVPDDDVAHMDADARGEVDLLLRTELAEFALVGERVGDRLDRPLEHDQETIGLVDLLATVTLDQVSRELVVLAE